MTTGVPIERALWSLEAEKAVLGAMLLSETAADEARLVLDEDTFYRPGHRMLFGAMSALRRRYEPIDITTLTEELKARGELANVGGPDYLTEIDLFVPTASNWAAYGEIAREKFALRRLETIGREILGKVGHAEGGTSAEIAAWLLGEVGSIGGASGGIRCFADVSESGGDEGVPTGIVGIDRKLGTKGAPKAQLNVIVAKDKAGKSTMQMAIALHAARLGKGVLYLSLADLDAKRVKRRLLRMMCGYSERWTADQAGMLAEFEAAKEELERDLTLDIGDRQSLGTVDVDALVSTIEGHRQRRARTSVPLDLVCVDYYQKLKAKGYRSADRVGMLDHCSDSLSAYAERSGLVVWMGSQLTDADQKSGRDLMTKGSRAPLEDCGLCIHLDRGEGESAVATVYRSRFGGMGTKVPLKFNPAYVRFDEVNG